MADISVTLTADNTDEVLRALEEQVELPYNHNKPPSPESGLLLYKIYLVTSIIYSSAFSQSSLTVLLIFAVSKAPSLYMPQLIKKVSSLSSLKCVYSNDIDDISSFIG